MIEIYVLNYLIENLNVPVYMEYPQNAPGRFVVLKKGDSGQENRINTALLVADSYGESLLEAAKLNEQVKNAFESLEDMEQIGASEASGDYAAFDQTHKRYRYQALQTITHYL